jgi:hypothetical protein
MAHPLLYTKAMKLLRDNLQKAPEVFIQAIPALARAGIT